MMKMLIMVVVVVMMMMMMMAKKIIQMMFYVADDDDDEYESPLTFPDSWAKRLFWIVMLPMNVLFFITIPDCRRPGCWKKLYMFTFINSIIWISGLSYIMVWMVTVVG